MGSIRRRRGSVYSSEDLKLFTENFSQKNFLGNTQFGKLYRGKIPSGWSNQTEEDIDLTVKISACHKHVLEPIDHHTAFKGEVYFLRHPSINHHPNFVRLIGCCPNGQPFGVVYEINPVDTLHNLIVKDSFNWIQRVKVALGFARLLDFLHSHESPYMVRNLDAAHILIDQDFNPVLSDFSMLSGGIMGDTVNYNLSAIYGIIGYVDPHLIFMGEWSVRCDVYIYGIILLSIIAKRVTDKERPLDPWVDKWAHQEYSGQEKCSLVHKSIQVESAYDVDDGCEITKLAMSCLDFQVRLRPTMKDIVKVLENLHVARLYRDEIGR